MYMNISYTDILCFSFSEESGFGAYLLGSHRQKYLLKLLLQQRLNKFMEAQLHISVALINFALPPSVSASLHELIQCVKFQYT